MKLSRPGASRIRRYSWLLTAAAWLGSAAWTEAQPATRVKDINTLANGSSSPAFLTNFNGTIFFNGDDGLVGRELWKTDGTAARRRTAAR